MNREKDKDVPVKVDLDPEDALRILLRDDRKREDAETADAEADEDSGE